uniref:AT-rich interactive domain-containing protein 2-like n=1 Tax=Styela clava TaxID=7725 RepID=UPI00193A0497|nr:AT-rich interactive domain-containing protein 2-like [Styela clava]
MESRRDSHNSSEQGQKEAFLNELSQFLSDKGRYVCRTPNLAGRTIDLHDLYNKITQAGGYQKVTDRGFWEDFLEYYGFPGISATLAFGLQKIYQLYLEDYERVHFFGDDEPQPYSRLYDGKLRRFRYPISESQRFQYNLNTDKPSVSDYDRVVLSLESCLPNEIDFAVNACTLLSGESRHVLKLPQCRRIVDALLLHAGIVSDGHDSYCGVLNELQRKTKHNYRRFWNNSVAKKSVLPVLLPEQNPNTLPKKENMNSENVEKRNELLDKTVNQGEEGFMDALQKRLLDIKTKNTSTRNNNSEIEIETKSTSKWAELFHGYRSLGVEDYEGQRVLQIALVLLNLSFEDFNVSLLARHPSLIRFVFLCIHSEYSCLRQTGLDILSNISSRIELLHLHFNMTAMIFDAIDSAVLSDDKFERIRGFEILANICRPRPNVDYVCVSVSEEVYNAAVQNLMINDVELLLAAIEALYRLSKLGESPCTKIIFIKGCIDILICLVTLNVRTFGPEKLSEIRLARRITPGQQQAQQPPPPTYQAPVQHHSHMQRQMQLQQKLGSVHQAQPFFATAAPTNPVTSPIPSTAQSRPPLPPPKPVIPQSKPQPKVDPTPPSIPPTLISNPVQSPPVQQTLVQQPPPVIKTPPPAPQVVVPKSSPPGVGPTYTHSEAGTVPPVFHYMPAPPTEITQDNSPESFTKLWIWATYEFESESYIPRVDVYCEYLASSNRYGRQGKTEVLSATDFGKCLKEIFPQASSRLFNQGRGQPQYHIAGIKKRATPLPVPGYQLKDPTSVFSSEYEKIPTTKAQPPIIVSANNQTIASSPSQAAKPPSMPIPGITTAVPIQQLQFQPIFIMSTIPGSNGVTLLPGQTLGLSGQTVAATGQVVTPVIQAVALTGQVMASGGQVLVQGAQNISVVGQNVVTTEQTLTPTDQIVAPSGQNVAPSDQGAVSNGQNNNLNDGHNVTDANSNSVNDGVLSTHSAESMSQNDATSVSETLAGTVQSVASTELNVTSETPVPCQNEPPAPTINKTQPIKTEIVPPTSQLDGMTPMPQKPSNITTTDSSNTQSSQVSDCSQTNSKLLPNETEYGKDTILNENSTSDLTKRVSPIPNTNSVNNHDSSKLGGCHQDAHLNNDKEEKSSNNGPASSLPVLNGFPEPMDTSGTHENVVTSQEMNTNETSMEVDNANENISKQLKSQKKSKELSSETVHMVNGYDENSQLMNGETPILNGSSIKQENDKLFEKCGNSLNCDTNNTKPATNEGSKVNTEESILGNTVVNSTNAISVSASLSHPDNTITESSTPKHFMSEQNCTSINTEAVASIFKMDSAPRPTGDISVTPSIMPSVSTTPSTETLTLGSNAMTPSTPTNPIPHSTLNQRLKDTITRRKNSQTTTSPAIQSAPVNSHTTPAPSVVKQYSYKGIQSNRESVSNLAQHIIPITPEQLHQQYQQHRIPTASSTVAAIYQGTSQSQVGIKRPHPQATVSLGAGPPAKILCSNTQPPPVYVPTPQQTHLPQQQRQFHSSQVGTPRPLGAVYRPPVPQQQHTGVRPNTPVPNSQQPQGAQQKPKPPTIDLMAPNASLLVLYRNVGKIPFANHLDEKEDAISKSVRLTATLILTNIARYSDLGRALIQKHEDHLANVAMSQMDCSPIVARLLSEIDL